MEATGYERDEVEPDMDLREDLSIRSSRYLSLWTLWRAISG